jgi:hypothetical protein
MDIKYFKGGLRGFFVMYGKTKLFKPFLVPPLKRN